VAERENLNFFARWDHKKDLSGRAADVVRRRGPDSDRNAWWFWRSEMVQSRSLEAEASGSEPEASAPRFAGDLSENPTAPANGVTRLCGIMERGRTALDGTFLTMPVRPGKGLTTPIRSKTALAYDEKPAINN
jgi:hypothetical protein